MKPGVSRDTRRGSVGSRGSAATPGRWLLRAVVLTLFLAAVAVVWPHALDHARYVRAGSVLADGNSESVTGEAVGVYDEPLFDVQVEGNATIPATAIAKHVKARPGRAVSRKEVREDVRSLYGTRWFFSVEPKFRRTSDGLVLVFRVLERPVVRSVEFQGAADKRKKHLIAETGLKPGSPFDPSANREAARRIESWYHGKGFAFARCELMTGGEKTDRDIVFRIEEGPEVRVTGVRFEGNDFVSGAVLKTKLQTKIAILWMFGGQYDPTTTPNDITALKQYYHSLGFFDVRIESREGFNDDRSHVTITYDIDEGIRYKVRNVEFEGNWVYSNEELGEDSKLGPGQYFSERYLTQDVERMKEMYGELGRLFARVEAVPRFLEQPGTADLVYQIDEDRPYVFGPIDVRIEGDNPHTKRHVVDNRLSKAGVRPGALANPKNLERAKIALNGSQVFVTTPGKDARIVLRKEEDDAIMRTASVHRGQNPALPVSVRVSDPRAANRRAGDHYAARFESNRPSHAHPRYYDTAAGRAVLQAQRRTARRTAFANDAARNRTIASAPKSSTRSSSTSRYPSRGSSARTGPARHASVPVSAPVVRGQNLDRGIPQPGNPIYDVDPQGDPFGRALREPPSTLYGPGIVRPEVIVNEAQTGRFMIGAGVNSSAGVVGNIVIEEQNFDIRRPPLSIAEVMNGTAWRGGGQRFRIEAAPGNQVSRYLVSWTDPYFLDTDYSFGVSGFYFNRFYPDWDETRGGGRLTVGKQFSYALSGSAALRLESVDISNPAQPTPPILADAVGGSFLSTVRFALTHDTRDSPFQPGSGHFAEIGYEQAFGDFNYPRFDGEYRQFFTVHSRPDGQGRHIVNAGVNLGWTGNDTPIFERFYAGGFQTFRGFAFRGVGPVQSGVQVGGQWLALGSVEYMFPVTADENLQLVAFSDFGTVENDVSLDHFRMSVGGGIRLTVPAMGPVPLAFDFGVPIIKEPYDDERLFSFFVGLYR